MTVAVRVHGDANRATLVYLPGVHGDWTLVGAFRRALRPLDAQRSVEPPFALRYLLFDRALWPVHRLRNCLPGRCRRGLELHQGAAQQSTLEGVSGRQRFGHQRGRGRDGIRVRKLVHFRIKRGSRSGNNRH
jgi:hypothetical protein